MHRRSATLLALALGPSLTFFSTSAHASNDTEAAKLAEAALYEDYLNLEFKGAEQKLTKAAELCQSACRPETKARVLRDMGVLYVAGLQKRAEGIAKFREALAVDPAIALDADLTTPDLEAAFAEAKATASAIEDPALAAAMKSSVGATGEPEPVPAEPAPEPEPAAEPVLTETPEPEKPEPKPLAKPVETTEEDCPPDFPGCDAMGSQGQDQDEDAASLFPHHWFTLGYQADFLLMSATQGVCVGTEFQCFQSTTYRDPSTPTGATGADGTLVGAGDIGSGLSMGTMRVLVGYDYAILPELLVGARGGFAFGGGPARQAPGAATQSFQPIHAEARVAYWFTGVKEGVVRPFIQASGGVAQVDARVQVQIVDRGIGQSNLCAQQGTPLDARCHTVAADAWRKTGTGFISGGLGVLFAVGDSHGVVVEGRALQMLGTSATAIGAELGYSLGI